MQRMKGRIVFDGMIVFILSDLLMEYLGTNRWDEVILRFHKTLPAMHLARLVEITIAMFFAIPNEI